MGTRPGRKHRRRRPASPQHPATRSRRRPPAWPRTGRRRRARHRSSLAGHARWKVTAVDFSQAALCHAATRADKLGHAIAERITWQEGDLGQWTPQAEHFDLVSCLYVHVAGSVPKMVRRLAAGVAPGGNLLLVGHRPVDPATGAPTRAVDQVQVSVDDALTVLVKSSWEYLIAEDRPRHDGNGVDALVHARRRS